MPKPRDVLLNEIRYAERLCQRTARLYRRLQAVGTFLTVVSGGATLSALAASIPPWVGLAGGAAFAVFGAAMIAIRPADRAAANEADIRKYAQLRSGASRLNEQELEDALNRAHEAGAPEIEPLRDVAFNDVMAEIGQDAMQQPLRPLQRLLSALA